MYTHCSCVQTSTSNTSRSYKMFVCTVRSFWGEGRVKPICFSCVLAVFWPVPPRSWPRFGLDPGIASLRVSSGKLAATPGVIYHRIRENRIWAVCITVDKVDMVDTAL